MRTVSGECHEDPWIALQGWGRGVRVRSSADLEAVRNFINDDATFRRAVVFENLTALQRRDLITAIEELGAELREFTDRDKAAMTSRATGMKHKVLFWGSFVLASPFLVANVCRVEQPRCSRSRVAHRHRVDERRMRTCIHPQAIEAIRTRGGETLKVGADPAAIEGGVPHSAATSGKQGAGDVGGVGTGSLPDQPEI